MHSQAYDANLDLASLHQAARDLLDVELRKYRLSPAECSTDDHSAIHVYRGGDRFVAFRADGGDPPIGSVQMGVGSVDTAVSDINSLMLHDLIELTLGGSTRGRYDLRQISMNEFAERSLHDLVEFAHEFLYGDIRSFIRLLALSHRQKHEPKPYMS